MGLWLIGSMPNTASAMDIGWRLVLCAIGFGFFQSPNMFALMTSAPSHRSGGASGISRHLKAAGPIDWGCAGRVLSDHLATEGAGSLHLVWLRAGLDWGAEQCGQADACAAPMRCGDVPLKPGFMLAK